MNNKKIFASTAILSLFATFLVFFQNFQPPVSTATHPNILIILLDDLGYGFFYNSKISTPNMDELRRNGLLFDRFYVHPMCSPTRAALLSGNNPLRYGLHRATGSSVGDYKQSRGIQIKEENLPNLLKKAGYATAHIGKWHVSNTTGSEHPAGLYDYMELWSGSAKTDGSSTFYNPHLDLFDSNKTWLTTTPPIATYKGYLDDHTANSVIELIANRPKDKPFFINYWPQIPHLPYERTPDFPNKPNYPNTDEGLQSEMISFFDFKLGQILDALDKEGITNNWTAGVKLESNTVKKLQ